MAGGPPGARCGRCRPSASQQEYLKDALARGLTTDEALRALDTFTEEFPEMTRAEICAWLLDKWRD